MINIVKPFWGLSLKCASRDEYPNIDWIYFACRRVDYFDQSLLLQSTFYTFDKPNLLFSLVKETLGDVNILDNENASLGQLTEGIDSGLQNSVIKHRVFEKLTIPDFRIGEDRLFILQALKSGFTLGFVDKVAVTYFVHDGNTSDTKHKDENYPKRISAMKMLLESYEQTRNFVELNAIENKALNKRLAGDYFWKLGYSLYGANKQYTQAIKCMAKAIRLTPDNIKFYKTLFATCAKMVLGKAT